MVHRQRACPLAQTHEGIQWNEFALRGPDMKEPRGRGIHLVLRLKFHEYLVFVVGGSGW